MPTIEQQIAELRGTITQIGERATARIATLEERAEQSAVETTINNMVTRATKTEMAGWGWSKAYNRIEEGFVALYETYWNRNVLRGPDNADGSKGTPKLYNGFQIKFPKAQFIKISLRDLITDMVDETYQTGNGQEAIMTLQATTRVKRLANGNIDPNAAYQIAFVQGGLTRLKSTMKAVVQSVVNDYTQEQLLDERLKPEINGKITYAFQNSPEIARYGLESVNVITGQFRLPDTQRAAYAAQEAAQIGLRTADLEAQATTKRLKPLIDAREDMYQRFVEIGKLAFPGNADAALRAATMAMAANPLGAPNVLTTINPASAYAGIETGGNKTS